MNKIEKKMNGTPPILQIVGYKNSGKTTFLSKIITYLREHYQCQILTLKHHRHETCLEQVGKDTWIHRQAGAVASVIKSPREVGITMNMDQDLALNELLELSLGLGNYHFILIEGFKFEIHPKIVLIRTVEELELVQIVSNIQLLLFWDKSVKEHFDRDVELGKTSFKPSFLLSEEADIVCWVDHYWNIVRMM